MAKQGRGRPPKPAAEKVDNAIYLRADRETVGAVEAYREREDLSSQSEAVRRLVRKALKSEGLL